MGNGYRSGLPQREWLCLAASAPDRNGAEAAAMNALAGTFESLAHLRFAETVAELTDNFYAILSVLRPESAG
ncbi:MAG: hypothetical protein LBR93_03935 [Treponema sp.]|nr:hypothetical protein [Treponema sp.]